MRRIIFLLMTIVCCMTIMAQQLRVTGVVTSADDATPVIGGNVMVKSTTRGTITDAEGLFAIDAQVGEVLVFSYLGCKSQEIKVQNAKPLHIQLEADNMQLEEVVAIGYGKMRKTDLTGAISSVSAEELLKTPAASVTTALQGRAAGVTVTNGSGQPGDAATIRIRGIGSAIAGNDPLYHIRHLLPSGQRYRIDADIERRIGGSHLRKPWRQWCNHYHHQVGQ